MTKIEEINSSSNPECINLFITSDLSVGVNELDYKNSKDDECHNAKKHRNMSLRESSKGKQCEKQLYCGMSVCKDFGKPKNQSKYSIRTHIPQSTFRIGEPDVNLKQPGQWLTFNKNSPMLRRHSLSETENRRPVPRKRSVCSMTATPRKNKAESSKTDYITSFQRSLKLLGLQPKDFGLESDNPAVAYIPPSRVEPTFRTRLTKRSYSAEDLKSVIQDHEGSIKGSGDHKTIANAVYEEWYFHKLDEARRQKEMEVANELNKKEHIEKAKIEQRQKAEENFIKWKELKKKQHQEWKHQEKEQKKIVQNGASGDFRFSTRVKPNQEEVFLLWKREKDKLLKQKRLEEKIKEEMKSNSEKKASSDIAFKLWKSKSDEILKEKALEKERKKQEKEIQKEKEEERRESAKSSFIAWKKKKDAETRKKIITEKKIAEKKKQEIVMKEAERLYEAEQAFEEWLDQIEERRSKQIVVAHKQAQRSKYQFPWSPGGSAHW